MISPSKTPKHLESTSWPQGSHTARFDGQATVIACLAVVLGFVALLFTPAPAMGAGSQPWAGGEEEIDWDEYGDLDEAIIEDSIRYAESTGEEIQVVLNQARTQELVVSVLDPLIMAHRDVYAYGELNDDGTADFHFVGELPADVLAAVAGYPEIRVHGDAAYSEDEMGEIIATVFFAAADQLDEGGLTTGGGSPLTGEVTLTVLSQEVADRLDTESLAHLGQSSLERVIPQDQPEVSVTVVVDPTSYAVADVATEGEEASGVGLDDAATSDNRAAQTTPWSAGPLIAMGLAAVLAAGVAGWLAIRRRRIARGQWSHTPARSTGATPPGR